jgi:hypothetical protein
MQKLQVRACLTPASKRRQTRNMRNVRNALCLAIVRP